MPFGCKNHPKWHNAPPLDLRQLVSAHSKRTKYHHSLSFIKREEERLNVLFYFLLQLASQNIMWPTKSKRSLSHTLGIVTNSAILYMSTQKSVQLSSIHIRSLMCHTDLKGTVTERLLPSSHPSKLCRKEHLRKCSSDTLSNWWESHLIHAQLMDEALARVINLFYRERVCSYSFCPTCSCVLHLSFGRMLMNHFIRYLQSSEYMWLFYLDTVTCSI